MKNLQSTIESGIRVAVDCTAIDANIRGLTGDLYPTIAGLLPDIGVTAGGWFAGHGTVMTSHAFRNKTCEMDGARCFYLWAGAIKGRCVWAA